MKVKIESYTWESDWATHEATKVYVDGELVIDGGYGGEPEDNTRYRDYSWVEAGIEALAKKLGAEVESVHLEDDPDK